MNKVIFAVDTFNEEPVTRIARVFEWEGVEYTTVPVKDALTLTHPWFYQVQLECWRNLLENGPIWNKIDPAVQDAIIYGNAYWVVSFVHEGIIRDALLRLDRIINKYNIPKHKILFVSGAHSLPENIEVNTATMNYWQSNIRSIWYKETGNRRIPLIRAPIQADKRYLLLNRKPREHRVGLLCMLYDRNVLDQGIISCHKNLKIGREEGLISDGLRRYIGFGCFDYDTANIVRAKLPMTIDPEVDDQDQAIKQFHEAAYANTYFSVITETFFRDELTFITEKVFRPILFGHPFIVVSTPHYLKALRELGYETFPEIFDESYDDMENEKDRLIKIASEITRLSMIPEAELKAMISGVKKKLIRNQEHFFRAHPPTKLLDKLNSLANEY